MRGEYGISHHLAKYIKEKYSSRCARCGWQEVNPYTGKALDVKSASMLSGANIQLWEQHDTCAQRWSITNENNYYIFRSACSDKVLDVSGANIASGTNIQIWDFNGTSAQKWVLE